MDYKLSKKWFLSIYGKQNLDTRKYRGLSSEAIPTTLGSDIVLKVGKGWKLKTGVQYQYNTIQKDGNGCLRSVFLMNGKNLFYYYSNYNKINKIKD